MKEYGGLRRWRRKEEDEGEWRIEMGEEGGGLRKMDKDGGGFEEGLHTVCYTIETWEELLCDRIA